MRYTEGTLNVDLVDRARSQLVWEAAVIGTVTKEAREKMRETVERAMKEAFARYPYVAGSSTPKK